LPVEIRINEDTVARSMQTKTVTVSYTIGKEPWWSSGQPTGKQKTDRVVAVKVCGAVKRCEIMKS